MISFVIPAHNEERLLGGTLVSIREAVRDVTEPHEIVVVNDASTDATASVALDHGTRVIQVNHRQIAATRNAGARAATGDWLIFVDADTVVNPAVVTAALAALRDGAVGGGCRVEFDGRLPLYARLLIVPLIPIYRWVNLAAGCFLFCTRTAFESVGGFAQDLFAAEELAMSRGLGRLGRFVILRETVVTSGRKLRTHSWQEILGVLGRVALHRRKFVQDRSGLDVWYGQRREDPENQPAAPAIGPSNSIR